MLAAAVPVAHAADPVPAARKESPIVIELKQFKVMKDANGGTKLVDSTIVVPGDVLEYRATYTNRGNVPLTVVANLPVPESVEYVKESAKSRANIPYTVALKDGQYASEPLMRKTVTASGATVMTPVPYAEYRSVRWNLGAMQPGSSVEVSIRTKVSEGADEAPPAK